MEARPLDNPRLPAQDYSGIGLLEATRNITAPWGMTIERWKVWSGH